MNIHEYQAKELFEKYQIPIHPRAVARNPEEARQQSQELLDTSDKERLVVKAQVHAGARGKGGGVKLVETADEAAAVAEALIGKNLITPQTGPEGKPTDSVLIEATSPIGKEYYSSIVLDRGEASPCFIVSEAGGMDIEEVAATEPEKIIKEHFSPTDGLSEEGALRLASSLVSDEGHKKAFADTFQKMAKLFIETDCSLVEINPLAVMESGEVIAIDAKINFDDHALYRQPEIAEMRDPAQEDPREVEASEYDLSYVGLTGNIGCIVNGAGLAMATMDIIKYAGGEPANFLDVGGGASKEKVAAAFKIILRDASVKAILVNIFGGIMRCDIVAEGIIAATKELQASGDSREVPIVVRLEGTNVKEGKQILQESGLNLISASSFEEAAVKVVEVAK